MRCTFTVHHLPVISADSNSSIAWLQTARGAPADILQLKEDTPVPKLAKGQVLVKGEFVP
jgi:hypothetical protein